ncbi:prevent-host-death family protein [Burkholderia stagnalis]|uniref:type II toxin-antitoxin system Phd/YefM family antitoxin n=1 Tax=Burkholderia stagnalis TaxID=1503054 RepID=UPI000B0768BB|nr:type II toxin-antitoxin system prevent-host-death family antitoxin [Burkholderia stagnalis]VWB24875.1 prevent-host-death family protein [Burkholderia stagnalis]
MLYISAPGAEGDLMESILARASIGISELKINPTAAIERADGPVAVLNRNKPVAYLIPAEEWEAICDRLEDIELAKIVMERRGEKSVSVNLEDL